MRILHTSDWHLGRSLYGRKRYEEFAAFLDWLVQILDQEKIDAILVAGDLFDTSTPSNRAQELYYRFLCRVFASHCRHVVIIAGNHDSPSFLNAPRQLLRTLQVQVVGAMTDAIEDEVLVLTDSKKPEAIVCAVPYLRDKDLRTAEPGETIDAKNAKLVSGLKSHYAQVCDLAQKKQQEFSQAGHPDVPILAMGHLFTSGGKTVDGDGVRDLYVGSLAHAGADIFPAAIDYLALGHLHVPQTVGSIEHFRYSGAPLPMGFGEATQAKKVLCANVSRDAAKVKEIPVPCFQPLLRITGTLDRILTRIAEEKAQQSRAWLEIEYTGKETVGNLREILDEALRDSDMEMRRVKNCLVMERVMRGRDSQETLDDLDVHDVFCRCLETFEVPAEERKTLTASYQEAIQSLQELDLNAE